MNIYNKLTTSIKDVTTLEILMAKIERQEAMIQGMAKKQGYKIVEESDGVFTFEKDDENGIPSGDYLNPIKWEGQPVTKGLFYWYDDIKLPADALADGQPDGWNSIWFGIIQ